MKKLIALFSFVLGPPSVAFGADSPMVLYIAGHVGGTNVHLDDAATAGDLAAAGFGSSGVSSDGKGTSWKAIVGVQLGEYFAVEVAAAPGGDAEQRTTLTSFGGAPIPPTALQIRYSTKDTFTASALGVLPLGKLSPYAKVGLYTTKLEAKASAPTIGFSVDESVTSNGTLFGLGIALRMHSSISARFEWERLRNVGKEGVIRESDVDVLSIGLLYRFR